MTTTAMKMSPQQQALLDWARDEKGSCILVARAGCGKTTTLLELVKDLPGESVILAYNKSIADELQGKLRKLGLDWKKAQASTVHSAGFSAWKRAAPDVAVDGKKMLDIFDNFSLVSPNRTKGFQSFALKAVSLAKQSAFGVMCALEDPSAWYNLVDHYGLEDDLVDGASISDGIELSIEMLRRSIEMDTKVVDFDDMILAPLIHKTRVWPKDWVLIDEAQDTNPARRALAFKMLRPGTGRLVAVGDPAQAIYGFTGASHDSLDQIRDATGAITLPLNITYRCPKAVVNLAQQWVHDIEAHETAPEGKHRFVSYSTNDQSHLPRFEDEELCETDAILCRNTKPLVLLAYSLIRRGVGCMVEGREIGTGLIKLAQRWKVTTINALEKKLDTYQAKEMQKWMAKGREDMCAAVEDKVQTLLVVMGHCRAAGKHDLADVVTSISKLFGDTPDGERPRVLTLSTVHKSKGREWDRVYILGRNAYMPSPYAKKPWQIQQENNLMYVAVTRAKREIIDVVV